MHALSLIDLASNLRQIEHEQDGDGNEAMADLLLTIDTDGDVYRDNSHEWESLYDWYSTR